MIKAAPTGGERLSIRSIVDQIEETREGRQPSLEHERDIFKTAKGAGYDVAAIRRLLAYRRLDAADRAEREALDDTYRHALGMAVDAVSNGEVSARQAAKIYGVGKTSIYKELSVREVSAPEMTAEDLGEWLPAHGAETGELPREMTADDLGDPLLVIDKERGRFRDKIKTLAASIKVPVVEAPTLHPDADADDLAFPPFLRRTA